MEDIYKIQVSVSLNQSIFTKLKELTGALNKADASVIRLTRSLRGLSERMRAVGGGAASSAMSVGKMETVFRSATAQSRLMNAQLLTSARRLTEVTKAAQGASASVGSLRDASFAVGSIGRGGGSGGGRGPRHGGGIPILPTKIPGLGMLAGLGIAGFGLYESAKENAILNNTLAISGINPGATGNSGIRGSLLKMIEKSSSETGISTATLAEGFMRMRQVDSYLPLAQLQKLFPMAAKAALIQEQVHGTSPVETMMALQEYSHMTGIYDPKKLAPVMNYANWASSLSPESLPRLLNSASYAMPTGRAMMNVDPNEILESIIFMKAAGIKNTKSGTWLSNAILNTIPKMHGTGLFKTSPQMAALREMGEINAKGVPTAFDGKGVFHPLKMIQIFLKWADHIKATMPKAEALSKITQTAGLAWGKQGERMVALGMSPGYDRMLSVLNPAKVQSIESEFGVLSKNNPMVQGRMLLNNLSVALQKLADHAIPTLTDVLKQTNDLLSAVVFHPGKTGAAILHGANEALNPFEWFKNTPRPFTDATPIVIHHHTHLDGKKIAEHVSRVIVGRHTHPTGTTSSNGAIFPATSGHGG